MTILLWAIPFFFLTMLIEWRLTRKHDVKGYRLKDSAASLAMGVGNLGILFGAKVVTLAIFLAVYEHRLFEIPTEAWWVWLLLIPAEDFCYYWYHRAGHEIRFFWAAHVNHHSSTSYNLSTALRQSWTSPLFGWLFWLPLPLLGFHPLMIFLAQSVSLLYQYWIHTELIDKMGPFEWVFNTPSHHRVHHGRNPIYLDRNHGGILIIWDRMFGTFQAEQQRPEYGLTKNIESYNPIVVAFHEWYAIARDVRRAKTWRGRLGHVFGPPGWREDGSGKIARDLRQEAIDAAPAGALAA
jgi:sterol desaturase/sphingolipid hydroxylase (fatty acid hydroxylase superfamily)